MQKNNNTYWIGGYHAVVSATKSNKRKVLKVISLKFNEKLNKDKIDYKIEKEAFFKKIFKDSEFSHQGCAALIHGFQYSDLKKIKNFNQNMNVIILNNINDHRNIGSIIRSASAFGFKDIIISNKYFNHKSPMLNKSASGCLDNVNIYSVTNINNTIRELRKKDFYIYGFDIQTNNIFHPKKIDTKKNVLIFGSENKGINDLTKKYCDQIFKIDIDKNTESLNVSNAATAIMYSINLFRNS